MSRSNEQNHGLVLDESDIEYAGNIQPRIVTSEIINTPPKMVFPHNQQIIRREYKRPLSIEPSEYTLEEGSDPSRI